MDQPIPPLQATIIPVTPLQQNCTLLWCTKTMRGAFVDPGGDIDRLKAAMVQHEQPLPQRMFALSTRGTRNAYEVAFRPGDWLVFGSETSGLPAAVRAEFPVDRCIRLPMRPGQRSLNLSNAVAVTVFEAWRQNAFGAP